MVAGIRGGRSSCVGRADGPGRYGANSFDASYIPSIPQSRGIDVLAIAHPDLKASNQYKLRRLNPQTQEPLGKK